MGYFSNCLSHITQKHVKMMKKFNRRWILRYCGSMLFLTLDFRCIFFLNVFVVVGRNDILQFRGTRVKFSSPFTLVSFFNATMGITFIRSDSCCFTLYGWKLKRKKYKISRTKQHMKCCSMLTWQDLILNRRCPCWMPTFCRDFPYHNRMANIMRLLSHWQTIPNN